MKTALLGILVLLSAACSGSDEGEACDVAHRDGTYLQTFEERAGGTCGALADQVVVVDADAMSSNTGVPLDCALDSPDELSADQCSITKVYTCAFDTQTISFVGITTERDGGKRLTGTVTATAFDLDGALVCRSTYDVAFVRQ